MRAGAGDVVARGAVGEAAGGGGGDGGIGEWSGCRGGSSSGVFGLERQQEEQQQQQQQRRRSGRASVLKLVPRAGELTSAAVCLLACEVRAATRGGSSGGGGGRRRGRGGRREKRVVKD